MPADFSGLLRQTITEIDEGKNGISFMCESGDVFTLDYLEPLAKGETRIHNGSVESLIGHEVLYAAYPRIATENGFIEIDAAEDKISFAKDEPPASA